MRKETVDDSKLATVETVASYLNVCTKTVYRLHAEGHLTGVKIGRALRFSPNDVHAYVEQQKEWNGAGL